MDPSTTLIIKLYEEGRENNKRILQLTTDLIAARVEITELKTQLRGRSMTQSPEVVVRNASAPPMNSLRRAQLDAAGVEYTIDQIDSFNRHVDNGWGAMNYDTLKSRAVLVSLGKDKGDKSILIWPAKSALDLKSIARGVGQAFVGTLENGEWIETTKETWNRIMARGRALLSLDENDFVRCIEMDFPGFRACEDSWLARGFREARTGWEKPSKKRGVKQMKVDDETREDIVGGVMTSSVVISAGRGESEVSIKTSSKKRPRLTSERASDDESAVAGNRVGPESRQLLKRPESRLDDRLAHNFRPFASSLPAYVQSDFGAPSYRLPDQLRRTPLADATNNSSPLPLPLPLSRSNHAVASSSNRPPPLPTSRSVLASDYGHAALMARAAPLHVVSFGWATRAPHQSIASEVQTSHVAQAQGMAYGNRLPPAEVVQAPKAQTSSSESILVALNSECLRLGLTTSTSQLTKTELLTLLMNYPHQSR